jgi:hypothetical protein
MVGERVYCLLKRQSRFTVLKQKNWSDAQWGHSSKLKILNLILLTNPPTLKNSGNYAFISKGKSLQLIPYSISALELCLEK